MSFDPASLGDLYPWTPERFKLPSGHELSYLDVGPKDAPALLMVHGNPTWSFYYRNLVKAFSGELRCIVPDHLGNGLSDKPQDYDYTLKNHVANLKALMAHLAPSEVHLVVHDWGGPIGVGYALDDLDKIQRVTILNTSLFRSKRIPFSINICRIPGFGALCIRGMNAFARAAVIRAPMKKLAPEVARGYTGPYASWADRVAHLAFVHDIPMHAGIPSYEVLLGIEERLDQLAKKPLMICWGGRDFCFNDSFLEQFKARFPEAEVHRFADAGHYVLEDAGEQVVQRMRAFLGIPAEAPAA